MIDFLLWYVCMTVVGFVAFPLAFHMLPGLTERGYTFSRIIGLLVWGYVFWLLTTLNWIQNNQGGILLAVFVLGTASIYSIRKNLRELIDWTAQNRGIIITVEILFLVSFGVMGLIRAANPEIVATEKPMELAFINAILRSPTFPPLDPWLSGYAISYYYYGYILVAMIAKLLGTNSGVAFNLGISLIFGLSVIGTFGLLYNLVSNFKPVLVQTKRIFYALLGPIFVMIIGNLGGLLEVIHARYLFWNQSLDGVWRSSFWSWLDIKDLKLPPTGEASWLPSRFLWWWRSSRVITDYDLALQPVEVIDEFPSFSFLLSDLHPHVLAIPFALLAIALALNLLLDKSSGELRIARWKLGIRVDFLFFAMLSLGGMAFLNIWDFPIYTVLFSGAYVLAQVYKHGWSWSRLFDFIGLGLLIGVGGFLMYLPWFVGFQSQAGGILPNLINPTRGAHLWVMFGLLLIPIGAYLLYLTNNWVRKPKYIFGFSVSFGLIGLLWIFAITLAAGISVLMEDVVRSIGAENQIQVLQEMIVRRLTQSGGWLTLGILLGVCLALFRVYSPPTIDGELAMASTEDQLNNNLQIKSYLFSILLILLGGLLVIIPDFIYLRDLFGTRMNTIFKFYYQSWLMWGIVAAFGSAVLLYYLKGFVSLFYRFALILILLVGFIYPLLGLNTKTNGFYPVYGLTLDGTAYLERQSPEEMEAINWLNTQPTGVLAEAIGGSYSNFARISTHTGMPSVLGWPWHEVQWRGSAEEQGNREIDVERLYCSTSWDEARAIIDQYEIKYVYIGNMEYNQYNSSRPNCPEGLQERKFERQLSKSFENNSVRIYLVP